MSDLISRSALIEAMEKKYEIAEKKGLYAVGLDCGFIITEQIIKEQPTVEAKPVQWIPCSERLPENIRTVVLSIDEITFPTFGWYSQLEKRWILTERDYIGIEDFTVSAWMPVPAKYNADMRGGKNER